MRKEDARTYVKAQLERYLASKGINVHQPFRCLNPDHWDQNPSMHFDRCRSKAHCFSCGADYDVFDVIRIEYGLCDHKQVFQKAYEIFGVSGESQGGAAPLKPPPKGLGPFGIPSSAPSAGGRERAFREGLKDPQDFVLTQRGESQGGGAAPGKSLLKANNTSVSVSAPSAGRKERAFREGLKGPQDFVLAQSGESQGGGAAPRESLLKANQHSAPSDVAAYCETCHRRVRETDYLKNRGIGNKVIRRFSLGFDPCYTRSTGGGAWRALIIPTGGEGYVARNTDDGADRKNRYRKHGKSVIFNADALREADRPVFVVEGEIDALSVIEVGAEAVALGGAAGAESFLRLVERWRPARPLLIAMDNDANGRAAGDRIMAGLERLGVPFRRVNPYGECKDANEALVRGRDAFSRSVAMTERLEGDADREAYFQNSAASHLRCFWDGISESVDTPCVPTGFQKLDAALDGGLYEGLYIVGAISSLGKTTLIVQIADQIAMRGTDVLIFSLEMARNELIAKSVSRHTLIGALGRDGAVQSAKTARGITTGFRYSAYSPAEREAIQAAVLAYGAYADHVYISEGVGDIGVAQIRETVQSHISFTGERPVVAVDYVQILAPSSERATDKQNTDRAVMELKRLSRDFKIPVIGISSFNRANYREAVAMEAYKESGAIEYSSDVLIGLQLKGTGEKGFDPTERKRKNPREVELVVLKNRNGPIGDKIAYEYYPLYSYWREA